MIAELGHFALVLSLGVALFQMNVPMMGAILEPKVAAAVDGIFQREAAVLQEYLAGNA